MSVLSRRLLVAIASGALCLSLSDRAYANSTNYTLGLNFGANETALTSGFSGALEPTQRAGVSEAKQLNWNNFEGANGTASDLVADDRDNAVATTASIEWRSNGTWASTERNSTETNAWRFLPGTADQSLMLGYLDTGNATTTRITVKDVPPELVAKGYNVYVYTLSSARANRGGSYRILSSDGTVLKPYQLGTNPVDPTTYVRDAGVNHTDNGTYLLFTGLAASSIIIEATTTVNPNTTTPRAPVNAVQLVSANLTDPIVGDVVATGQHLYVPIFEVEGAIVDTTSVAVKLDSEVIAAQASKQGNTTAVVYDVFAAKNTFLLAGSAHVLEVTFKDMTGKEFTATRNFTVGNYITIPTELALPVTDVDTTKSGFNGRITQMVIGRGPAASGFDGNSIAQAERHLAGGYIDPATGQSYANIVDPTTAPNGQFIDENIINFNQNAPAAIGSFSVNSVPAVEDEPVPGIPGTNPDTLAASTDNYVVELQTYLVLKAGAYRFAVNSDDGFKVSVARSPGDVNGLVLGSFNGGRGVADTMFDFVAPVDGAYPIRLLWWEGGSDSALEFFAVDPVTGAKTLINDLSVAAPIRAYRATTVSYPAVTKTSPHGSSLLVLATSDVVAEITDGTITVDANSVSLTVNGQTVTGATKAGAITTIRRPGSINNLLLPGVNTAQLAYSFTSGGQTVTLASDWTFTVGGTAAANEGPRYTIIPAGNKAPAGSVDTSGFKVLRVHQLDRSRDGNQGNGDRFPGDGNRMPRPEIQLNEGYINRTTGTAFPNYANLSLFNTDGTLNIDAMINFNQVAANSGVFNPNEILPGMPGQGTSPSGTAAEIGTDNYVMELVTYLDLKAGAYLMSINSDDGYVLSSAPNPRDSLGTVVAFANTGTGSASPPTRWFSFVVLEDGLYPFRLIYWEGSGGGNLEWMSVEPGSGLRILVNNPDSAYAIKAYREYSGPVRPWVKFSVSPTPWDNIVQQTGPGPITLAGRTPASVDANDIYNRMDLVNNVATNRPWADVPIGAIIADLGAAPVRMLLNGEAVTPEVSAVGSDTKVVYKPAAPLPSASVNTASLVYAEVTNSWTFTVQTYTTIPESLAQSGAPDESAAGFRARVKKIQNGTANIATSVQRAEDHLRGVITNPDKAVPGPEADGSYIVPGIINWNQQMRGGNNTEFGNFRSDAGGFRDDPIPGVGLATTGEAASANDLVSAEVIAFLDLPAGYIKMGINSDDGFRVTAATGYEATPIVLGQFDAGKGATDIPFSFVVPKAGLYPIRVVWFEGSGDANLEFFSYGVNGEKIPINDRNNPAAIKAYYKLQPTTPPQFTKIAREGGNLVIEWTGGGTLETSDKVVGGTWTDTTLTSPASIPENQVGNIRFGRVRR